MNQVTYRLNPYFFPHFDQLPARWANSALPEQVAEDAKETSPNSSPNFFPHFDQLPARWANSALPEQVAEDAKETSPNSLPIAAPPLPLTVLLRAAPPCLIRPGASHRPAIAAARLAAVCGFALGGAQRAFFVVAEANRTKRRSTSNSRSSALNPSISKRTSAMQPKPTSRRSSRRPARRRPRRAPDHNRERGFGQRLQNSADVKCRESPNYLT